MYVLIVPLQIKEGKKAELLDALLPNAQGAVRDEPGCLRFDVIQDAGDPNRLWLYEVYQDEAAFHAHQQAPHYLKAIAVLGELRDTEAAVQGAARGSANIWPPDAEWK